MAIPGDLKRVAAQLYAGGGQPLNLAPTTGGSQLSTQQNLLVVPVIWDASASYDIVQSARTPGDGNNGAYIPGTGPHLYNGTSFDKQRANTEGTLLASAARTATTSSIDATNHNARGVLIFFAITAVPGVDTVTLTVTAKDPVAGTYETLLTGAAESATGTKLYMLYPGAGAAANGVDVVNAYPVPRTWRVTVTHSGAGSFTYSVGYAHIL